MRAQRLVLALAVTALLAGCFQTSTIPETKEVKTTLAQIVPTKTGYRLDVPVDVILFGFHESVRTGLGERLKPLEIRHATYDNLLRFPPNPQDTRGSLNQPLALTPNAVPRVQAAPAALEESFFAQYAYAKVADAAGRYDANVLEAWLSENLPRYGIALNPNTPALVLIHAEKALGQARHSYRYTYGFGYVEPVRVFGERSGLLALDASAARDPFAAGNRVYGDVLERQGEATVNALAEAIEVALNFRLLQGPLYPPSLKTCHAVTLVYAVRMTAIPERAPGFTKAEAQLDAKLLKRAFENVTGEGTVHVDVKRLNLPLDDPALDAVSRHTPDAVRWWINEHWRDYWVPHEGCEPYVSFLLYGDATDAGPMGIAMYDVRRTHRISYSEVTDKTQVLEEYNGPGSQVIGRPRPPSRAAYNWVNFLYAHETGHLLAQRHPHDITMHPGETNPLGNRNDFSSVWSSMSYQVMDRQVDFGQIDHNNFLRNRVAMLVGAAQEAGHSTSPRFQEAIELVRQYEWAAATKVLTELVATNKA